jgi:hypothetical protein
MPELKDIPDEVKWRLAAQCAASLPAMYDAAFRSVVGEQYDELEQECWMALSGMVRDVVRDLALPVRNAKELATSMQIVLAILFGPDYRNETFEVSEDGAVILIKRCPFILHGNIAGAAPQGFFSRCMALTLTTIPLLNEKYTARYVRTMCSGDRHCEIKIEVQKPPAEKKTAKK